MKKEQASSTAFTVLQGLLYIADYSEHRHLVPQRSREIGEAILKNSEQGLQRFKRNQSSIFRTFVPFIEKLMVPGITLHYALRKHYIEQQVRRAIENGATQIVNLGAGFDTLLCRLSEEFPELNCIEIDHPATHRLKKNALNGTAQENLHFLPIDFTCQTLEDELSNAEFFDPSLNTMCIIEGVLMYLTEQQVAHLLNQLKILIQGDVDLVFSAVEPMGASNNSYGPLLKLYLMFKSEPLHWQIDQHLLSGFLQKNDFQLIELAGGAEFRQKFIPDYRGAVHQGEYFAVAKYQKA